MDIVFKACHVQDVVELQELSISTFTQAFEKQNDPNDFNAYLNIAFSKAQLLSELENQNSHFYFAFMGNTLVGYLKTNVFDAQNELRESTGMELERIYVTSSFQGQGIGIQMLSFVESLALNGDKTYIWLGVWEHNPNAIRFYQRFGYVKFGRHPYYIGNDKQTDWLLKKHLK